MPTMTRAGYIPPKPEKPAKPPRHEHKPKRKKKKRGGMSAAAAASLIITLIAVGIGAVTIYIYTKTQPYLNAFVPGTMLQGYPLGGASMEDAQALLEKITAERIDAWQYEFTYEDETYTLTAEDAAFAVDAQATLEPLWAAGREGGMVARYVQMLRMQREPVIAQPVIAYSMTVADELLERIRMEISREAVDAQASFVPGSAAPFRFTDEVVGLKVNTAPLREGVERAMQEVERGGAQIVPERIEPNVYRAELENATVLRARTVTKIVGDAATAGNVQLAAEKLGGARIEPGESLSFNETVGRRTAEAGYVSAAEPAYGEEVYGVGGGVCQASTALYRTALLAGMEVTERSAAVRPLAYCEMGQEAVVSGQGLDLVIRNDTRTPLYLMARTYEDGDDMYVELSIIGEPLGRRYALRSTTDETGMIEEPVYVRDREGRYATYTDERIPVGEAKMGYVASVARVTLDKEGRETQREIISEDIYEAIAPTVYVGVTHREK